MNAIFIHPPIRSFNSPSSSLSDISGFLRSQGYETKIKDFNIDFYNNILTDENVIRTNNLCLDIFNNKNTIEYKGKNKENILKFYNPDTFKHIIGKVALAKEILRTKQFYNPIKYRIAHYIIQTALKLISLPYTTWILNERSIIGEQNGFSLDTYRDLVKDKYNIFMIICN